MQFLTPRDVFTPRASNVNPEMYIMRDVLERQVKDCLSGHKHFIIHGESGNGKTWLWKRVFEKHKVSYTTINLGRAAALGSVRAAIAEKVARENPEEKVEDRYEGGGQFKPAGIGVDARKTVTIRHRQVDPFIELIAKHKGIRGRHSIIVFDNFEWITSSDELVKEFASYLLLLDDEDYAQYYCRICIVGVPGNLKEFFSKLPFAETITTRLYEVDEVARMTPPEAEELLMRGFSLLRQRFPNEDCKSRSLKRLTWVSDRNAEQLQELGLAISTAAKDNSSVIDAQLVQETVVVWIHSLHSSSCAAVEAKMSPADTLYGRRNQILYSIGLIEADEFGLVDIKRAIRKNFEKHSDWLDIDFEGIFGSFFEGNAPLLRAETQQKSFRLSKAVYRMAIRSLLKLNGSGELHKVARSI